MPKGIYIRTKPHWNKGLNKKTDIRMAKLSETNKHSDKVRKHLENLHKQPRTLAQLGACRENGVKVSKLPNTQKQREVARKTGLNNKGKLNPHGPTLFGNTIVEHHNDLCYGAERPDDITLMTSSEHLSLHNNLRIQNGSHHFLNKKRK